MIELVLAPVDLSRVRFGHSPVRELVASIRSLNDPKRAAVYAAWRRTAADRLAGLDLDLLSALSPVGPYAWDFLAPPIVRQWAELAHELDEIVQTRPPSCGPSSSATGTSRNRCAGCTRTRPGSCGRSSPSWPRTGTR